MMQQAVYDALAKYVGNPAKVVPWLAESWDSSPDAKTWTFHLAKNAKFHNGDPVDAEAVRYSFERGLKLNKGRSEEHTSELQSLMRISYAVFCLKKKKKYIQMQRKYTNISYSEQY